MLIIPVMPKRRTKSKARMWLEVIIFLPLSYLAHGIMWIIEKFGGDLRLSPQDVVQEQR